MNTLCIAIIGVLLNAAQPEAPKAEPKADVAAEAARLVADLATDPKRGAAWAEQKLRELGPEAAPALEAALDSKDMQQRHLAAHLLRRLDLSPSERLLRVTYEGLAHDSLPRDAEADDGYLTMLLTNAIEGTEYLARHAARAEPLLERGLDSADAQQQFLCAAAAGAGKREKLRVRSTRLLIPHLASNAVEGDAYIAAIAIHRFGTAGLDDLRAWKETGDAQQRALVAQLITELENPGDRAGNRRAAAAMGAVAVNTGLAEDTFAEMPFDATEFYWEAPPSLTTPRAVPKERDRTAND